MYPHVTWYRLIFLLFVSAAVAEKNALSPRIVIVGAGASGIAAASKLFENGFNNVVILEAEDRIGGRVHTVKFGGELIDLGGQWVHGQVGNVAYELAAPLGLLENSSVEAEYYAMYESNGKAVNWDLVTGVEDFFHSINGEGVNDGNYSTAGDYFEARLKSYFKNYTEISEDLQKEMLWLLDLAECSADAAVSWHNVSLTQFTEFHDAPGDHMTNWKKLTYGTILDILMKKVPNPEEELPVLNNTVLNTEVAKVDYTNAEIKITTTDGREYLADHVIMTPSLGVLKAQYETLFDPPLPEKKVNSIQGLEFGTVCKTFLHFDKPWWITKPDTLAGSVGGFTFLWKDTDRTTLENDPARKWLLGSISYGSVAHKPNLLAGWFAGEGARLIENSSDVEVFNETMWLLHKFLGEDYNITEPTAMIRTKWLTNKHFRGTYSYRSAKTDSMGAFGKHIAEPVTKFEKPVLLFAGEHTNDHHYSTVHGAIETGWRAAKTLINLYFPDRAV